MASTATRPASPTSESEYPSMEQAGLRLVYDQLDNELNENALFLLDRLQAIDPNNSSWTHLRSLCCLRLGRFALACEYSRDKGITGEHAGCSYVFAQSCLQLGRFSEGITALEETRRLWGSGSGAGNAPYGSARFSPSPASINRVLAKLYRESGDFRSAAGSAVSALEADPFMWDVFTDLCDSDVPLIVSNVFKYKSNSATSTKDQPGPPSTHVRGDGSSLTQERPTERVADERPTGTTRGGTTRVLSGIYLPQSTKRKPSGLDILAPETGGPLDRAGRKEALGGPAISVMSQRRSARLNRTVSSTHAHRSATEIDAKEPIPGRLEKQRAILHPTTRKPTTLKQKTKPTRTNDTVAGHHVSKVPEPNTSQTSETGHATDSPFSTTAAQAQIDIQPLLQIFTKLGTAYHQLRKFQPKACLETLASLPPGQRATPWVISKIARSQYEMQSYEDSKSTFRVLRKISPSWTEELEVYSIVLWHLSDDVLLAFHAHELSESHYLAPQTWCAIGNTFSLKKAHLDAIRCFKRATQLEPQLAHSYSLLGHEHLDAGEHDEASTAFRRALQINSRHYIAFVGLGQVQERLGNLDAALKNYTSATKINPTNGVLLTRIAKLLDKLGKPAAGLKYLQRAVTLDVPDKLLAYTKLQIARLLLRVGSPRDALRELQSVEKIAPDEADVYFMLGNAYLMAEGGSKGRALRCFTVALSLDPASEKIREAMSALEDSAH